MTSHCCITFDKFIAVWHFLSYSFLIGKYFVKLLLSAWLVAVVVSLMPLFWKTDPTRAIHQVYLFVEILLFIFLPYLLIVIAYCLVFKKLREHVKLLQEATISITRREQVRRVSSEAKVAKVCLILIATFAFC